MSLPNFELTLILGRAITLLVALLVLAWAVRYWRRRAECDAQRMFEQLDLIRGELMLMYERIEQRPAPVIHTSVPSEPRAAPVVNAPAPRGYEVAARLARSGATCEELVSSCGLSRNEAQLLLRLHGAEAARKLADKPKAVDKPKTNDKAEERRPRLSMVS